MKTLSSLHVTRGGGVGIGIIPCRKIQGSSRFVGKSKNWYGNILLIFSPPTMT